MKSLHLLVFLLANYIAINGQNIGIGTNAPHPSAALEIKASNKGLLIPRTSTASRTAIVNPAKGLMVYDTTSGSFWYFDSSLIGGWSQIGTGNNSSWSLGGNAGTNPALNFLGTTDASPIIFKVNNVRSGIIDSSRSNSAFGFRTLDSITFGFSNAAFGYKALTSNTNGNINSAYGANALKSNKGGGGNTSVGAFSLFSNDQGDYNTATGAYALYYNKVGDFNTAIGTLALNNDSIGSYNTAIGSSAMDLNKTGNNNTAAGHQALTNNFSGNSNVAVGSNALYSNINRSNLVAIGDSALYNNGVGVSQNIEASGNTAVGSKSLYANTTGASNTAVGKSSLYNNYSGSYNTAIGFGALAGNGSGNYNTAVGAFASISNSNFENATAIGANAVVEASNSLILGNNVNVGIGTSTPTYKLDIQSNFAAGIHLKGIHSYLTLNKGNTANSNYLYYNTDDLPKWALGTSGDENFKLFNSSGIGAGLAILINSTNNNVGIGSPSPASKLHVQSPNIANVPSGDIVMARYWPSNNDTRASSIFHYYNAINTSDNLSFGVSGEGGSNAQPNSINQVKMIIQANGRVGIGTLYPIEKLDVAGLINASGYRCRPGTSGSPGSNSFNIYWTGASAQLWIDGVNIGTFSYTSDRRLKDGIKSLDKNGIERMLALNPVQFNYKKIDGTVFDGSPNKQEGFIADELQLVIPSAVDGEKSAMTTKGTLQPQTINIIPVVAVLAKAMQEQQVMIDALQKENAKLKTMQADIEMLKSALLRKQ